MCKSVLKSKPDSAMGVRSASDDYSQPKGTMKNLRFRKIAKFEQNGHTKKDLHALPTSDSFRVLFESKCNKKVFSKPKNNSWGKIK